MPLGPNGCSAVAVGARSPAISRDAITEARTPFLHSCCPATFNLHESTCESIVLIGLGGAVLEQVAWAPTRGAGTHAIITAIVRTHRFTRILFSPNTVDYLPRARNFAKVVKHS